MPPLGSRDDPTVVDELLQQGLTLYAANRVEQAVARWRQVLEMVPGEPRALDYLASAGYPFAEGTGQEAPISSASKAPDTDEIAVFEVAPISHQSAWPRTASGAISPRPSARAAPRRRLPLFVPWAVIAGLAPVVAYLAFVLFGGGESESSGSGAVVPSQPAATHKGAGAEQAPAPTITPGEQPAEHSDDIYVVELTVIPSNAVIELDGQRVARGDYVARFERDGTTHRIEVSAPGYRTRELTFVDEAPPTRIKLVATERGRSSSRKARRGQRSEGERAKARREEEPAEEAPAEPPAPQPAPVRKSDNINPWASPQ
jgi:hypothetical protein